MKGIFEPSLNKEIAISFLKRIAGYSFFSDETEMMAIHYLDQKSRLSMADIASALVIAGVESFDTFSLPALCEAVDCKVSDIPKLIEKTDFRNRLPIHLSKKWIRSKQRQLTSRFNKLDDEYKVEKKKYIKNHMQRISDVTKRLEEWRSKGWIIVEDSV